MFGYGAVFLYKIKFKIMNKNSEILVSYTAKDGSTQKAMMRHADQLSAFIESGRSLLMERKTHNK